MSDYLYDKTGQDEEVAELERILGGYAHTAPLRPPDARKPRSRVLVMAGAFAAAALVLLVIKLGGSSDTPTDPCARGAIGMPFAAQQGTTRCGGAAVAAGTLPVGTWLETAHDAITNVQVASIGDLTVYGGSRLRLVGTGGREHRFELASGRISARVTAPPRLFVVDTPAATAVD